LASESTIEIGKELIRDSVFIHKRNIEYLQSKEKKVKPLYTDSQMLQMFDHMESIVVNEKVKLNANCSVIFYTNSHVIGATSILLEFTKPNNQKKSVLYSSDMGSEINRDLQFYLDDNKLPKKCNIFISEATYNDKSRQFTKKDAVKEREYLKQLIKKSILENKRMLFATFSFSRSQLLITMFYEWFKDEEWFNEIPIILDGVLVNKINATYLKILKDEDKTKFRNVLNWENIKVNTTYEGTQAILSQRTVGIYISSSGFCENGKIVNYLPHFLSNPNDVVILTGFAGNEGSIGWKITNPEQKSVTMDKKTILKRAEIHQLKTFSSHISYSELLQLFNEINCEKVLVHHSNDKNKYKFCEEAKEYLRSKGDTKNIVPVNKGANQFVL
jgi:metallo-beta-lactamase family protein